MLSFSGSLKILVALEPCDMRKSYSGLLGIINTGLGEEVRSGTLFVFSNKKRTRLKILYWDGTGLWILCKRLERGSFSWPRSSDGQATKLKLAPEAFAMLTDGIDMNQAHMRAWYDRGS